MTRDFQALARERFDLLIIGGGIHGLFAALESARRGWRTALVERDDFGSGLSFNHQRTVHGGLRALQTGSVRKTRHQIAERRRWAQMAPAHLRPLPFVVGTYRHSKRSRLRLGVGLGVYDAIGASRNDGLPPTLHLPPSSLLSIDETMARFPGIETGGMTGGATWSDYQAVRPDRVNWLVALAAVRAGATLVNHAEAMAGVKRDGRLVGAAVRDVLTGAECEVSARATLIAAGAGVPAIFDRFGVDEAGPQYLAAANVLVDRAPLPAALAAPGRSGRMLTAVPWAGATLIGTFQATSTGIPGSPFPLDVDAMLAEANEAFPALSVTRADVRLVHRGWTPAAPGKSVDLLADPEIIHHTLRGLPGLITLVGVKFTTARSAALKSLKALASTADLPMGAETEEILLPYSATAPPRRFADAAAAAGLPAEVVDHLERWYGDEAMDVIDLARSKGLEGRLDPAVPVIEAEIAYAAATSLAGRLGDAVLRRTALGSTRRPHLGGLERAADIMQDALGWDDERRALELRLVDERYRLA